MSDPQRHYAQTLILSVASAAVLGLLSWIALTTAATREDVAAMKVKIESTSESGRRVDAELLNLRTRLASVELEVAVLRRKETP